MGFEDGFLLKLVEFGILCTIKRSYLHADKSDPLSHPIFH
jgi:hypothetical protein